MQFGGCVFVIGRQTMLCTGNIQKKLQQVLKSFSGSGINNYDAAKILRHDYEIISRNLNKKIML